MNHIIKEDLEKIAKSIEGESEKLSGKTLLISGGSGFLGSYIIGVISILNQRILKTPCHVVSIDNFITGSRKNSSEENNGPNISRKEADVSKPIIIDQPVDYIIHAAGLASPVYYQKFPLETIETTIIGVKNLLELSRKNPNFKSFLFFSSSEIYGDPTPENIPTPESYRGNVSSIGPRSCYDESKRLAETICITYHRIYQTPVKIVRPFNVYGPGMKSNDYRVVPNFIAKGMAKEPLPVHDKGSQTRTFCYISDAVTGFFKVLLSEKNGEIYNVGTDKEEINMFDLARIVADAFTPPASIQLIKYPDNYPADEPRRRCPDISKIKQIGYQPQVDLKAGLSRTVQWFGETMSNN